MFAQSWTVAGFLDHFVGIDARMPDRAFAFVLGAGASVTSGIPAGGALVYRWLHELHRQCDDQRRPFAEWATAETLGIEGFDVDNAAQFYPEIYQLRFGDDPEAGYAYLEEAMKGAEPSFGYSVLAQILANTRHRVVLTTNFDTLVADALAMYARTYPLVCGHESLTGFIRPVMRRPLIAKIHRDLLLAPVSEPSRLATLPPGWKDALKLLFRHYTPIVIGYGGNDGGFMGLLQELEPGDIQGRLFWCYRAADGLPGERIQDIVARHRGKLVPIAGFDELMLELGERLGKRLVGGTIKRDAEDRLLRYRASIEVLLSQLSKLAWWTSSDRVGARPDLVARRGTYEQALELFPDSVELHRSFAKFAGLMLLEDELAEHHFARARELAPDDDDVLCDYGSFLAQRRANPAEAERLFRLAILKNPDSPRPKRRLANHLYYFDGDLDEAEALHREVARLEPSAKLTGNLAAILLATGRLAEAEAFATQAWDTRNTIGGNQRLAEVAFLRGLIARVQGRDDEPALRRLKVLLALRFDRIAWTHRRVLAAVRERLFEKTYGLYAALSAAILDADRVAELDAFERWTELTPLAVDAPWP